MRNRVMLQFNSGRTTLLSVAIITVLTGSIATGVGFVEERPSLPLVRLQAPQNSQPTSQNNGNARLAFEVTSIKPRSDANGGGRGGGNNVGREGCAGVRPQVDPRRFAATDTNVWLLITWAYSGNFQYLGACEDVTALNLISGAPAWVKTDKWDIEGLFPEGAILPADIPRLYSRADKAPKLQRIILSLLEDRFRLVVRRETREVSGYALTMPDKAGLKVNYPPGFNDPRFKANYDARPSGDTRAEGGYLSGKDAHIADLIPMLARETGKPVVDRTGFTGQFTFFIDSKPLNNTNPAWEHYPNIFKALEDQVGLKLEETKTTAEFWVIERLEKPSGN